MLSENSLLGCSLDTAGEPTIKNDLFSTETLGFFVLNNIKRTFVSLESMFGRYSRYGSPVENLITLWLS